MTLADRAGAATRTGAGAAAGTRTTSGTITTRPYTHPHVQQLIHCLHDEQVHAYGFADDPTDTPPGDFDPPNGLFIVVTVAGAPAACGGWRRLDTVTAEVKRMYAVPALRGRGLGHLILQHLERDARATGARRMLLETGRHNQRALRLYIRHGYIPIPSYVPGRNPQINRALHKDLSNNLSDSPGAVR